jgi:F-type H+-transporting ATPase subunit b
MEATLQALGEIVLKALPTFFLLVFLHFYLKFMFFGPLERVLKARYDASAGAKKAAEQAMARAEAKAKEYEEALRAARTEIYKENDALRAQWRESQMVQLAEARQRAESSLRIARAEIAAEVRTARETLEQESHRIAETIATAIAGRAA